MPKKKEESFKVLYNRKTLAVNVENEVYSDIEMVGILTVLLDAYKNRFGGGADASPESSRE